MTSETTHISARPHPAATFDGAAGPLTGGLAGMLVGAALAFIGMSINASHMYTSPGTGWIVCGLIALAGGAVFALCGLFVLLTHIDNWARARR